MLDNLYTLFEIVGKTKQLVLNLCDLFGHHKVLFTSAELNKYLIQIRNDRKLALPFFISNFGSILLGQMVKVYIVSVPMYLLLTISNTFFNRL